MEQDYWLTQPQTSCVDEIHRLERCYDAVLARVETAEGRLVVHGLMDAPRKAEAEEVVS